MWIYQKKLEYPVNITTPNPRMAKGAHGPVRRTGQRTGRRLPLPYPTLLHAG